MSDRVDFLIVGSARSGTTLLQRLAGELDGVRIPFETHFFTKGVPIAARHGGFPVAPDRLPAVLDEYVALDVLAGSGLTAAAIAERLPAGAPDALTLFDAVVGAATGGGTCLGEKTPGHLRWAGRLAVLRPELRIVAIVRDPRAVVASQREVSWAGGRAGVMAERWCADQRIVLDLRAALPERLLLVRYEDLVADPDASRSQLGAWLGAEPAPERSEAPQVLEWETWKGRSGDEVTTERVEGWRAALTAQDVAQVTTVAGPLATAFGYGLGRPGPLGRARVAFDRSTRRRRAQLRARRDAQDAEIAATGLGAPVGPSNPGGAA